MIVILTNSNQNATYWKAERFVLEVNETIALIGDSVQIWCTGYGSISNPIASYNQTISDDLKIDVTGLLRAYKPANLYWCVVADDGTIGQMRSIAITYAGLINPAGVLIPEHDGEDDFYVVAPSLLYRSAQFPGAIIETRPKPGVTNLIITEFDSREYAEGALSLPSQSLDAGAISFEISKNNLPIISRVLNETYCERTYACVEWVSFTGATRRHIFEIAKAEVETGDVVTLANILNEWTEIKGRVDGFTLRLENLDRYDLWYYSDLITSNNVRVTIDGVNWYNVHVDENAYTLPESNAGKLSTLEIPVKFRKYDAVSL